MADDNPTTPKTSDAAGGTLDAGTCPNCGRWSLAFGNDASRCGHCGHKAGDELGWQRHPNASPNGTGVKYNGW